MRFTDKAAEASLKTPKGLSPALIGKIVEVRMISKKDTSYLHPESLIKYVGVLKNYTLLPSGFKFALDGGTEKSIIYNNEDVEVIVHSGS